MTKFCCECEYFMQCVARLYSFKEPCGEHRYAGHVVGGDRKLEARIKAEPWPWEDMKGDNYEYQVFISREASG